MIIRSLPRLASSSRRSLLALVILCTLTSVPAVADEKGAIDGTIGPAHDHDFILATARIPDLALNVGVAEDGTFRFDSVRPGSYLVEVRVPTLGTVSERVEVRAGETTTVSLELVAGSHSEEIVVTASANARDPLELATASTSLSGQELALRQEATLGETLSGEPGVSSTFFGPGASRPVIRGLTGDRVRMLEGGLGTGDASGVSADHAVSTEPIQAERIEILRGPATLRHGSSAVGGVVNVIDERIPTVRAARGLHGNLELRGGSNGDERQGSASLGGGSGNWAWNASASVRESDDYEVPGFAALEDDEHGEDEHEEGEHEEDEHEEDGDEHEEAIPGIVENTDIETEAGRFGATYFFGDRGFLGVSVSGFDSNYGLPAGGHGHGDEHDEDEHDEDEHEEGEHEEDGDEHEEDEHGEEDVRIDMKRQRFDLRSRVLQPFSGIQAFDVRLAHTDYEHVELEGDEIGTFFFNDAFEARFEMIQEQRGRASGSFGLQYLDRQLDAIGAEAFIPETDTERWALFTLQEIEAGDVTWQFGARFESQDTTAATGISRSHDGLSASAGLVWSASETFSIAASLARSVKMPAAEELFSNGLHIATQAFEIGNANLTEEIGLGFDLAFRFKGEVISGELTLFRQDFDDFIFQAFTGEEEEGFPVVLYSQADAEFTGAELKTRIELVESEQHHLHLSLVGDFVDADLSGGGNLPRIPPMRFGGGLHYHSERWNASTEVRWVDDQTDTAINETPTDGYTMVNASLGYRFLLRNQIIDLLLRGRNLTDEEGRSHTSFLKNIAPLPGRNVTLSAKMQF